MCRSFFSTAFQRSSSNNKIDEFIQKLDFDVRRVGRVSKREIEQILNEINISSELSQILFKMVQINNHNFVAETATPSQSLMILRCCGNLVPDELPENRTKLVQQIWETINSIGIVPILNLLLITFKLSITKI